MTNFPREVCKHALAHVIEGETKAAYRRSDVLAKRRRIEEWTAFCTSGELTPALSPCPDSLRFKADGQKALPAPNVLAGAY